VIRVLLADDENLIRSALAALLALEEDLEVVAQAASGAEALAMARAHTPTSPSWTCRCPTATASPSPASWPPCCPAARS
jgi:CheY-like chemotaxis protein